MAFSTIGYHTRLAADITKKIVGGSFQGELNMETVNRLVRAHFTVEETASGRLVFIDKSGRVVNLYVSVDPEITEVGKAAAKAAQELRMTVQQQLDERRAVLGELLDSMDIEQAIRLLKREE